jgi:3-oxoacyl-[acyl-carrier protein] reductase
MGYFDGKVAIITGAARGLGFDYARFFLQDGAHVVLGDINCAAVQEAALSLHAYGKSLGICLDVTDVVSTQAMARQVLKTFGRADILVNNAAIWGDLQQSPLLQTDSEYWDKVMNTNVKGALLCSRALVPIMRLRGWGRIINISSGGAYKPGGVYSVSKLPSTNSLTAWHMRWLKPALLATGSLLVLSIRRLPSAITPQKRSSNLCNRE